MVQEILIGLQEPRRPDKFSRPKTVGSDVVLQTIERVALKEHLPISVSFSSEWFVIFTISAKSVRAAELYRTLPKYYKTFDSSWQKNSSSVLSLIVRGQSSVQ